MKVHKVTLLVYDFENAGIASVKEELGNMKRLTSSCIATETKEVDWTDEHPLNFSSTDRLKWWSENE